MAEECTDCVIDIEPKAPGEKEDTTRTAGLPTTTIEKKEVTGTAVGATEEVIGEEKEEIPEDAKVSGMLGLLTAGCLLTDDKKREECWKGIEPLETNKEKPLETVKRIIDIEGAESLERTLDALRDLVEEAKKAKENR